MIFKSEHIKPLDGIRGFAVLFVVIHHIFLGISDFVVLPEMLKAIAVSGVDLFFVLSGFLIGGIIIDEHKSRFFWKKLMLRRIRRIFPVYFLVIGTFVIAMGLFQHKWFLDKYLFIDPLPVTPYFVFFGAVFFGLYMYHQLINGLLHSFIYNSAPSVNNTDSLLVAVFVFIASVLLSVISLKYFEYPIRSYCKNKTNRLSK